MNELSIKATIREHRLVKLVKSKLSHNPSYHMNVEELVAFNAVMLEEQWNEQYKADE